MLQKRGVILIQIGGKMKPLLRVVGVTLILLIFSYSIIAFAQNRPLTASHQANEAPTVLPSAISDFPDITQVPIYPSASILTATNRSDNFRQIVYEVSEHVSLVRKFYRGTLPIKGWVLRSVDGQASQYSWAEPTGKSPWHLYLQVVIGLTLDESKTLVTINYGRYPNTDEGLPLYVDAHQVVTTHSSFERIRPWGKITVYVTDTIYMSYANPEEIANFYNTYMPEYGWFFFDRSGSGPVGTQTGDINSAEGLYFTARYLGWGMKSTQTDDLFVTAKRQEDGRVLVKLHIEHFETSGPNI